MKIATEKLVHYAVLILVTIGAGWVMWFLSAKGSEQTAGDEASQRDLPPVVAVKAPVVIEPLQVQMCELYSTYSGKIRPWETYQIAFEVSGRVQELGTNAAGQPLDAGDRVAAGQVLAVLDERVFSARRSEAAARVEQSASDARRARTVRQQNPGAVTESELQRLVTEEALARAQLEVAIKNLEDATLRAPVDATISKRMLKAGESVTPNQMVFELVQNGDVLLVVDVPESDIRELEDRMRTVEKNLAKGDADNTFQAHVRLEGRDRFGNAWPPIDGKVFHIAEVSDQRTGLFEVEIELSNEERLLRPGMVATADLVTARIPGYRVPEQSVIHRQRRAHLFTIVSEPAEMEMLYWKVGDTQLHRARQVNLDQWVEQGPHVVIPAEEIDIDAVVVRGHLRLADGQLVRVVNPYEPSPGEVHAEDIRVGGL